MLEREELLERGGALIASLLSGRGGALFVEGEPGLGKTTALTELAKRASTARIVRVNGEQTESANAFSLVRKLLGGLDGNTLREGVTGAGASSAHFFDVLRRIEASAAERAVVLVIDGLHCSDPDSLELLGFLCRRLEGMPAAVLAALRPWPPSAAECVHTLVAGGHAELVRLQPLGRQAARTLLRRRSGRELGEDVVERALSACAGNPFLLEQVAHAGESIPEAVLTRFAGVPPTALACARAATVLGARFLPAHAAEMAELGEAEATTALDALWRNGLVRQADGPEGLAEFVHPLFAQALYDGMPPATRADLHGRAFRLLARSGLESRAAEHAVRGRLSGDQDAVALLERIGRQALRAGASDNAVLRLREATELADEAARPHLQLLLGSALVQAGRAGEATQLGRSLLEQDEGAAARLLGHAHYAAGAYEEGSRFLERAAELTAPDDPDAAAESLLLNALQKCFAGGPRAALDSIETARRLSSRVQPRTRRRIEIVWGYLGTLAGDADALGAALAAARELEWDEFGDERWEWWRDLALAALAAKYREHFSEADSLHRQLDALIMGTELAGARAAIRLSQAELAVRRGRLDEALGLVEEASGDLELASSVTATGTAATHAHVLALLDRSEESVRQLARAEDLLRRGGWLSQLTVWDVNGLVLLANDRATDAAGLYTRAWKLTDRIGLGEPCVVPWAGHALWAYARAGRRAELETVLAWLERCARALPCLWPRIASSRGRAFLAAMDRNQTAAEALFAEALELNADVELPLQRIETLIALAGFLARQGDEARARPLFAQAAEHAAEYGAELLAGWARRGLAQAGGRPRRRRANSGGGGLSPVEERVAQLAADGLTNREIAAELWLSVNTVKTHLRHAYAKLGVSRRGALAGRLGAADPH